MKQILFALSTAALVAFSAATGSAQAIPWLDLSSLGGSYSDNWTQLTQSHYGSSGSFPGNGVAVSVGPDSASSYAATFDKTTSSESGYLAGSGFYAAFSQTHLDVHSSAVSGVQTLIFQLNATTGSSGAYVTVGDNIDVLVAPTLTLFDSGGGVIASGVSALFTHVDTYASGNAGGFSQNDNLDSFQWNLSSYSGVASFALDWQVEYHADVNGAIVTQSTTSTSTDYTLAATPEPPTWAMMFAGVILLAAVLRRRAVLC